MWEKSKILSAKKTTITTNNNNNNNNNNNLIEIAKHRFFSGSIKLAVFGAQNAGKTAFLQRFINDQFDEKEEA